METVVTRGDFIRGSLAMTALGPSCFAAEVDETDRLRASKAWFRTAGFGLMAHFGLYSVAAGEWRDERCGQYSEWMQWKARVPVAEWSRLAKAFNPIFFDPREWMLRARDAGVRYFTVTAKHHDGFAMFRSRVSRYNVVDMTPFGRDVIGEIAEACRETGIRLGIYYSQAVDWSEPDGAGYDAKLHGRLWANDWDWPDNAGKDYARCYERKIRPQVEELLTQYGDLALIWFDTPVGMTEDQSRGLRDLVRRLQPGCLVSSRIGNGLGDYESSGDNKEPPADLGGRLFEMVGSHNRSFGYKPFDTEVKSVDEIRRLLAKCRGVGANYLLNFGPDHLGRMGAPMTAALAALAALARKDRCTDGLAD